jgi:nicotinate phosphoribosyltransferase
VVDGAQSFPSGFLALVDTYDTINSGVENFIVVAAVLAELGYAPVGIRLDSGDLAYLSLEVRPTHTAQGAWVRACFT